MPRKHVVVHGRVQGVAFRHYSLETATHLGVRGWIRNRSDRRRVELVIEGDDDVMQTFLEWLHEGPSHAAVEKVDVEDDTDGEVFEGFEIRPTL